MPYELLEFSMSVTESSVHKIKHKYTYICVMHTKLNLSCTCYI